MTVAYYFGPLPPTPTPPSSEPPPRIGAFVRRVGETLSWEVIHVGEVNVIVQGPAGRHGLMTVTRPEFDEKWERA